MFQQKIGIDLGTANTLVYLPERGIILNEPTVVAVSLDDNQVLAVGQEAREMIGRTPEMIVAHRPMKGGVVADYRVTEAMLRYFITKGLGKKRWMRPEVLISVPGGITSTEKRAVIDAAVSGGAKKAYLIKETVAAAIGAGISIASAVGNLIVDIGGGTTDVAVLSLGGIVTSTSVRTAGNSLDAKIAEYIRIKHGLTIGERTAESLKIGIGSAVLVNNEETMEVKGRDNTTGLPRVIRVRTNEIAEAIKDELAIIVRAVKGVVHDTPPELVSDIIDRGITLTGGTSMLKNLDKLLQDQLGVPCAVAEEPLLCVAKGTGMALDNLDSYKRSVLSLN